jgi:hypothetical protein
MEIRKGQIVLRLMPSGLVAFASDNRASTWQRLLVVDNDRSASLFVVRDKVTIKIDEREPNTYKARCGQG